MNIEKLLPPFVQLFSWLLSLRQSKVSSGTNRFLIVEDTPEDAELIRWTMTRGGYDCDLATTAETALDLFIEKRYRLVFIDLRLPVHDGWWLANEILNRLPKTRIVIAAGSQDDLIRMPPGKALMVIVKDGTESYLEAVWKSGL